MIVVRMDSNRTNKTGRNITKLGVEFRTRDAFDDPSAYEHPSAFVNERDVARQFSF
jgi:hypothetical protein